LRPESDTVPLIVALSGPVCAGKTTLARWLERRIGARTLTTRALIGMRAGVDPVATPRGILQELGETLDRDERGTWVASGVRGLISGDPTPVIVVDAVRTLDQVRSLRDDWPTVHVHLWASAGILAVRYDERRNEAPAVELQSFEALQLNATEAAVPLLAADADLRVDTGSTDPKTTSSVAVNALRSRCGRPSSTGIRPRGT
jgi:adenylosuccinate synthase